MVAPSAPSQPRAFAWRLADATFSRPLVAVRAVAGGIFIVGFKTMVYATVGIEISPSAVVPAYWLGFTAVLVTTILNRVQPHETLTRAPAATRAFSLACAAILWFGLVFASELTLLTLSVAAVVGLEASFRHHTRPRTIRLGHP